MGVIEVAVHAKLSEAARAEPLGVMALALAGRLDAGPGDDVATRLNRELRLTLAALAGPDSADDVEAFLDRIAAPGLGPPRTSRPTYGPAVAEVAGLLGVRLTGWQSLVLDRALEHEAGQPAYREVDLSVPRQCGKSTLALVVSVWRMLAQPGCWLSYTTASRLSGRRKMLHVWWPMIARSPLGDRFRPIRGMGSEALECVNGSLLLLLSSDQASGHGDTLDGAFLDEAWSLTEDAEAAVRPTMSTRPAAQLWAMSTAGTAKSA